MNAHRKIRPGRRRCDRGGVAAVEFAIVLPLIVLILLGAIDVGQSIYVAQVVNEASREGARQASRFDTTSETTVRDTVLGFVQNTFPSVTSGDVSVSFTNSSGDPVTDGDLTNVSGGSPVTVQVSMQYDSVRWIPGFIGLGGRTIETTTIMRRE
jgi:Flp pilus assembly protein TadG